MAVSPSINRGSSSPATESSVCEAGEKPFVLVLMGQEGLPATLPPYAEGELSEFHVSICAEVISSTRRCGWTRCQLHTAVFEWRQGEVARLRSKRGDDGGCPELENLKSEATFVHVQKLLARRLHEPLLHWARRRDTHPEWYCVLGQQLVFLEEMHDRAL